MIKRVFFDLDECLVYSVEHKYNTNFDFAKEGFDFQIEFSGLGYKSKISTSVRPTSKKAIQFAQNIVGPQNVFILSAGSKDYVIAAAEKAGFGIPREQIYGREDWSHWNKYYAVNSPFELAEQGNVLIDNEVIGAKNAYGKRLFLGIDNYPEQYKQIPEYWGDPSDAVGNALFLQQVEDFIMERMS